MQLFLHILKMMQILHFFHTWLTVASSLDIIHQDRTGEASAGKLKFGEGEELKDLQLIFIPFTTNPMISW